MASSDQKRITRSASCYPNSTMRRWSPYHPCVMRLADPIDHHVARIERQLKPNTSPHHLAGEAEKQRLQDTPMTSNRTWKIEPVRPYQSMDHGSVPQREKTTIKPGATSITMPRPKTAYGLHPNCVVTWPDNDAPHTPNASPMR